jgi:hypothetical protein
MPVQLRARTHETAAHFQAERLRENASARRGITGGAAAGDEAEVGRRGARWLQQSCEASVDWEGSHGE